MTVNAAQIGNYDDSVGSAVSRYTNHTINLLRLYMSEQPVKDQIWLDAFYIVFWYPVAIKRG